jgi:hypothetical protein
MPISDRLIHSLAIVTPTDDVGTATDEYGQPIPGEPTVTNVSGLIQPKSAREIALISQAGAQVSDHTVFLLRSAPVENASYIRFATDDGDRYEVTGIRDFAYGMVSDHLEVDCRRVHSEVLVTS